MVIAANPHLVAPLPHEAGNSRGNLAGRDIVVINGFRNFYLFTYLPKKISETQGYFKKFTLVVTLPFRVFWQMVTDLLLLFVSWVSCFSSKLEKWFALNTLFSEYESFLTGNDEQITRLTAAEQEALILFQGTPENVPVIQSYRNQLDLLQIANQELEDLRASLFQGTPENVPVIQSYRNQLDLLQIANQELEDQRANLLTQSVLPPPAA